MPNLHNYIEQAAEIASMKAVVFTGGECFLLGKHLDELVLTATRNKLRTRFVSNGYWASTPRVAAARLRRMADNGLGEANFSTGDMHAKYVKPAFVINGAVAAAEMGLPALIMVETFSTSQFSFDEFIGDSRLKPLVEAGKIAIKMSPWMQFQGKTSLVYTPAYLKEIDPQRSTGCGTLMNVLAVNPSEDLIACCGLTLEEIEELHLGSLKTRTIKQILRETPDDFIKIWIHLVGPDSVIAYALSLDPTIEVPPNLAHICASCRFMYNHPRIVEVISATPPPFKDDLVRQYAMSLFRPVSEDDLRAGVKMAMRGCNVDDIKTMRKMTLEPA